MTTTERLALPLLAAGQAQKEVTHNEALILLDAMVNGCCGLAPGNAPPAEPELGISYICGVTPTGEWAGHPKCVAYWSAYGWRFINPVEGMRLHDRASGQSWCYSSGQWLIGVIKAAEVRVNGSKVLGAQQAPINNATGGAIIDSEARNVLSQVLAALRTHGLISAAG